MPKGYKKDGSFAGRVYQKGCIKPKNAYKFLKGHLVTEKTREKIKKGLKKACREGKIFGFQKGNKIGNRFQKGNTYGFKKGSYPKSGFKKGHPKQKKAYSFPKGHKLQIKQKHWNWKGGITDENLEIRNSIEYRLWNNAVLARDNWTCQKYRIKGGNLETHHIQNFSQYPKLRFAIDNGITLSKKAHKEFHKKYGIKNNTREQLEEFLEN